MSLKSQRITLSHCDGEMKTSFMYVFLFILATVSFRTICALSYDAEQGTVFFGSILDTGNVMRNVVARQVFGSVTKDGYKKIRTPSGIQRMLKEFLFECCPNPMEMNCGRKESKESLIKGYEDESDGARSRVCDVSKELSDHIGRAYLDIFQKWYGGDDELEITSIYGVRSYHSGATLQMHVDRPKTHVVSAILNVAQDLDEDWPLLIHDFDYTPHNITMAPGESVLYESMTLSHGRPYVLRGRYYSNIFIHSVRVASTIVLRHFTHPLKNI